MQTPDTKTNKSSIFGSVLVLLISGYMLFNILSKLDKLIALNNKSLELQSDLNNTQAQRIYMESKVARLNKESLDLDLVDELARQLLGYSQEEEYIYILQDK